MYNQWRIHTRGGEIRIIDRTIAGVSRPSHEAMAVIPTTGGVCDIVSSTQSVPRIYHGTMLVAHSTSSLANRAGIVVVVIRRQPEPEKSAYERCV